MRFEAEIEKVHTSCQKMCRQKMVIKMWSGLHRALPAPAHIKAWFSETGDFFWQYHELQIMDLFPQQGYQEYQKYTKANMLLDNVQIRQ